MIINCLYEENCKFADVVYLPETMVDVEEKQEQFFKWMFDKSNNHSYWISVNGEKKYCEYGTQAFVDWINENLLKDDSEKARIVEENASLWDATNICLYF